MQDTCLIFALGSLAVLPALIHPFYMWDDWITYFGDPKAVELMLNSAGVGYVIPIVANLVALPGEQEARIAAPLVAVAIYLFSWPLFYAVLKRSPYLDRNSALIIAFLTAVIPVNFSKSITIAICYSLSLPIFILGLWFFERYLRSGNLLAATASWVLFLFALFTQSFGMLYVLFIVYIFLPHKTLIEHGLAAGLRRAIAECPQKIVRYSPFLILPVVSLVLRGYLFPTFGLYENYNKLTFEGLIYGTAKSLVFAGPMLQKFIHMSTGGYILPGIFVAFLVFAIIYRLDWAEKIKDVTTSTKIALLLVALALISATVMPYIAVGKTPYFSDWSSRWQLPHQLVAGISTYCLLRIFTSRTTHFLALIAVLCGVSFNTWLSMHHSNHIRQAFLQKISRSVSVQGANTVILRHTNKKRRSKLPMDPVLTGLRFYEISTAYRLASGNAGTLFLFRTGKSSARLSDSLSSYCKFSDQRYSQYGISEWASEVKHVVARVDVRTENELIHANPLWTIASTYYFITDAERYRRRLEKLMTLTLTSTETMSNPCT